jgi:hypothetical protein
MEQVAQDYVREIVRLLPNTLPPWTFAQENWSAERPTRDDWYMPPSEVVGGQPGLRINVYTLPEWDGVPQDQCSKATQLMAAAAREREEPTDA